MLAWRKSLGKYGLVKSDCEIPTIKDDEVLVKVLATGICGTDFGIYKGYREVEEGLIPGHEFIGEIVKLGSSVTGYEVGDRVVPSIVKKCGKCPACIQGFEAQCENLLEIGIHINGSFAEYVAVPEVTLHKVGKDMDLKTGASTGQRCSDIWSGSYRVIYGADRQNCRSGKNSYGGYGGRPGSSGAG